MAKMAEDREHVSFRDRARAEYEERRAVGRLAPAQRTCATLDEKAGIQVRKPPSFPSTATHPSTRPYLPCASDGVAEIWAAHAGERR